MQQKLLQQQSDFLVDVQSILARSEERQRMTQSPELGHLHVTATLGGSWPPWVFIIESASARTLSSTVVPMSEKRWSSRQRACSRSMPIGS